MKSLAIKYFFIFKQLILFAIFYGLKSKKLKNSNVIFFFPFYHTGGAEQVHLDIVKSLSNPKNTVLFSGNSSSTKHLSEFKNNANVLEINNFRKINKLNNYLIKYLARIINKNKITVFGCNCHLFYKILPHLDQNIKKIDLIHAFSTPDYGFEQVSISSIELLTNRIVINNKTKKDFIEQYQKLKISDKFVERIIKIENGVKINKYELKKDLPKKLKIGFIGRWSEEKRPELFVKIANNFSKDTQQVDFYMIGSQMERFKSKIISNGVNFIGEILEKKELEKYYQDLDILLITSKREGFPMVIMEAMSFGVVVISTDVGGINEHIASNQNGILINNNNIEQILIEDFIVKIKNLLQKKIELQRMSENSFKYAIQNFDINIFNQKYQELLN